MWVICHMKRRNKITSVLVPVPLIHILRRCLNAWFLHSCKRELATQPYNCLGPNKLWKLICKLEWDLLRNGSSHCRGWACLMGVLFQLVRSHHSEIKKMKDPPNQLMWGEPIHVFGALELFGSMLAYRWTPKCRKGMLKLIIRQQDSNVDQSTTNQKKQSLILFYIATIDRYFLKKKKKNHYRQASSLQLVDSGEKKKNRKSDLDHGESN